MTTPIERTEAAWTLMRAAARVMEVAELWLDAIHTAPNAETRDAARQNFERCMAQADRARDRAKALMAVQEDVEEPVEGGFEARVEEAARAAVDHRKNHRPGFPRRIDTDAELRAFILARIDHMSFPQLARAVADAFPPHRRVSKTAIHNWYRANHPG